MSLAEVCATSQEMSMWSFSGGVTLNVALSISKLKIKLCCYPLIFVKKIPISCSTKL